MPAPFSDVIYAVAMPISVFIQGARSSAGIAEPENDTATHVSARNYL